MNGYDCSSCCLLSGRTRTHHVQPYSSTWYTLARAPLLEETLLPLPASVYEYEYGRGICHVSGVKNESYEYKSKIAADGWMGTK